MEKERWKSELIWDTSSEDDDDYNIRFPDRVPTTKLIKIERKMSKTASDKRLEILLKETTKNKKK